MCYFLRLKLEQGNFGHRSGVIMTSTQHHCARRTRPPRGSYTCYGRPKESDANYFQGMFIQKVTFLKTPTLTRCDEDVSLAGQLNIYIRTNVCDTWRGSPHAFTCASYQPALLPNKHADIDPHTAISQTTPAKNIRSNTSHPNHNFPTNRCPPVTLHSGPTHQASIMNRLFGAKNNAPKPTLTSAISNVRLRKSKPP